MNKHEVFAKVKAHLLAQGKRSMGDNGCAYRGANGRMCALGCLIPDDKYVPEIEGSTICSWKVWACLPVEYSQEMESLLVALQRTHDQNDPEEWAVRLGQIAVAFGIEEPS